MKQIIVIIAVLFLTLQVYTQPIKYWGFKGGVTVSKYSEWNPTDTSIKKLYTNEPGSRVLINLAFFAEGFSTRHFSTICEIGYNPKGASFVYPTLNGYGNVTGEESIDNRNGYLSISLSEKARVNIKSTGFYVYAGPRIDIELNESSEVEFVPTYKKFNKFIYGLTTGFGIELVDRKFKIIAELQYEPDLSYTLNDSYGKVKKNTWLIRIGAALYEKK